MLSKYLGGNTSLGAPAGGAKENIEIQEEQNKLFPEGSPVKPSQTYNEPDRDTYP